MNCPLCGQPMIHYRLHGYQCHNRDHRSVYWRLVERAKYDDKKIAKLVQQWRKENGYRD